MTFMAPSKPSLYLVYILRKGPKRTKISPMSCSADQFSMRTLSSLRRWSRLRGRMTSMLEKMALMRSAGISFWVLVASSMGL